MKKAFVLVTLLMIAFIANARQKPVAVLVDDEFNPWFDGAVQKTGPVDNSRSTAPLPSKMDQIDPDSTVYKPTKLIFKYTRPEGHLYPTKRVIKRLFPIPRKMEKISDEFDLKR